MTKARDLANIISGGFTADDIPNLDTAKITSGTLADARFPATLPAVSGANLTNLPSGGVAGISSSADATAITIDSSENVGIGISPTPPTAYGGLHIHSQYPVMKLSSTATGSGTGDGFVARIDSTPRVELWNFENSDMVFATNNTERMRIDNDGHVTKPTQPAVQAYVGTIQSNISTGITTVQLDSEIYDVNSDFNPSNYTFTAPVTGKYLVTMNLVLYDFDNSFQWLYVLGVASNRNYYLNQIDPRMLSQDGIWSLNASSIVDMDANDTFQMKVRTSSHGAAQMDIQSGNASATETTMTMTLLS